MRGLAFLRSPWIAVAVAILGGLSLGLGVGRMWERPDVLAAVYGVLGVVLLWWAISDSRKARPGTPESEADGSHTIE
jgi:Ni/Fe-hydrogenase subunit HybB-like protein